MATFVIEGGHKLHGTITPQGAKNEALQVLCAVLLTRETVVIDNLPNILDVNNLIDLLASMGVTVEKLSKGKLRRLTSTQRISVRRISSRSVTNCVARSCSSARFWRGSEK